MLVIGLDPAAGSSPSAVMRGALLKPPTTFDQHLRRIRNTAGTIRAPSLFRVCCQ